jgi:histidinol-phosphate aminotransferase
MFDTGDCAARLLEAFFKRGILVRNGAEFGMPGWLRVTIGTEAQNLRVLEVLEQTLDSRSFV